MKTPWSQCEGIADRRLGFSQRGPWDNTTKVEFYFLLLVLLLFLLFDYLLFSSPASSTPIKIFMFLVIPFIKNGMNGMIIQLESSFFIWVEF